MKEHKTIKHNCARCGIEFDLSQLQVNKKAWGQQNFYHKECSPSKGKTANTQMPW